ncbi:MAG: PGPGW domain-containing protein [Actinomycetota bacterium]|nr:PGPGW domain-containing protein [Acidimicrobiales bacterium]
MITEGKMKDNNSFKDAAIEAELETGEREPTRDAAWSKSIKRLFRVGSGLLVTTLGLVMMLLPGPGLLTIAIGLSILSRDVAWADRLLSKVRARLPSNEHGKLPRSSIVTMTTMAIAGVLFSIWATFLR